MSKWYGKIGYAESVEVEPGDWGERIIERYYRGDMYRNARLLQKSDGTNNNVNVANQISIVADPYANDHIFAMRYVEFQKAKWEISTVEVQDRRLILTVGGLWNGD